MTQFSFFEINGQVDTKKTILANLNDIAGSSQSFLTWDPSLGSWRMILNRPINLSTDVALAFDDDNIVGPINVSGSGITDKYNILKVDFVSKDLEGERDETYFAITANERYSNEVDNTLNVSYDLVADQWQAERMGKIELKQSRVDKIITFATDYRAIALKPGEVITVTNEQYGYTNKPWRIQSIEEIDTEDGGLLIGITALEYDVEVYDTTGITVRQRDRNTGIVPAESNLCVFEKDNEAVSNTVANSLNTDAGRNNLTQDITVGNSTFSIPLFQTETLGWSASQVSTVFGGGSSGTNYLVATFQSIRPIKTCYFNFEAPQGDVTFTVDGSSKSFVALGIPCRVLVYQRPLDTSTFTGIGGYTLKTRRYLEWSSYFTQISLSADQPSEFEIRIYPVVTYDLTATTNPIPYTSTSNYIVNANGDYASLNIAAFLN